MTGTGPLRAISQAITSILNPVRAEWKSYVCRKERNKDRPMVDKWRNIEVSQIAGTWAPYSRGTGGSPVLPGRSLGSLARISARRSRPFESRASLGRSGQALPRTLRLVQNLD